LKKAVDTHLSEFTPSLTYSNRSSWAWFGLCETDKARMHWSH